MLGDMRREILIKTGEISFALMEDTMMRIVESYRHRSHNVYVLSNGIFATIDEQGSHPRQSWSVMRFQQCKF